MRISNCLKEEKHSNTSKSIRELQCYRIIYRGIVSLLSTPTLSTNNDNKSGAYVSYGEVIASSKSIEIPYDYGSETDRKDEKQHHHQYPSLSPTSSVLSQSSSTLPLKNIPNQNQKIQMISTVTSIEVDQVLTGGYSIDTSRKQDTSSPSFGYCIIYHPPHTIAQKIPPPKICESGAFIYKVTSRTPLQILLGPCLDAPLRRSMALPNMELDVCLRIQFQREDILFLRLVHKRGWIADRKTVGGQTVQVVKEVSSAELKTPIMPKRRNVKKSPSIDEQSHTNPTSPNVTMISDDPTTLNALESPSVTIDTSVTTSEPTVQPTFFLMRVRTRHGLKILDAPQYQVNRLIHGSSQHSLHGSSQRIFPRNTLFEASSRMETLYAPSGAAGSIKLSDASGWCIISSGEEAYEEIGNAIPSLPSVWVRVLPRTGVVIAYPTAQQEPKENTSFFSSPILRQSKKQDSDKEVTLPCGLCVEVDQWEQQSSSPSSKSRQSFARLRSGSAWIPRFINNELFSYIIQTPKIQSGTFWYRVIYKKGMKVRQGPSRRAPSLLQKNAHVRFECGEFVLISDVYTLFGPTDTSSSSSSQTKKNEDLVECFGKLYSSDVHQQHWIHIQSNGRHYLQEQDHAPKLEQSKEGWSYDCIFDCQIYVGPSFSSLTLNKMIKAGDTIVVHERISVFYEKTIWLRFNEGYVPHRNESNDSIMILRNYKSLDRDDDARYQNMNSAAKSSSGNSAVMYDKFISRFFNNEEKFLEGRGTDEGDAV